MAEEEKKIKFVVKAGQHFGLNRLAPGTEVELTEEQAAPFLDKLEPADRKTKVRTKQELSAPTAVTLTTDREDMTPEQRANVPEVHGVGSPTGFAGASLPSTGPVPPESSEDEESASKKKSSKK